jgi:hypothetical protein
MHVRTGGGLARSQQPPGQVAHRWRRLVHTNLSLGVIENATEGTDPPLYDKEKGMREVGLQGLSR